MNQSNWKDNFHMWQCVCVCCTFVRFMFLLCINSRAHTLFVHSQTERLWDTVAGCDRRADRQTLWQRSRTNIFDWQMPLGAKTRNEEKQILIEKLLWQWEKELAAIEFIARKNHLCVCVCVSDSVFAFCSSPIRFVRFPVLLCSLCVNYFVDEPTK